MGYFTEWMVSYCVFELCISTPQCCARLQHPEGGDAALGAALARWINDPPRKRSTKCSVDLDERIDQWRKTRSANLALRIASKSLVPWQGWIRQLLETAGIGFHFAVCPMEICDLLLTESHFLNSWFCRLTTAFWNIFFFYSSFQLRFWEMDPSSPGVMQNMAVTVRRFEISPRVCSRFKPLLTGPLLRFWKMDLSLPWVIVAVAVTVRLFKIISEVCSLAVARPELSHRNHFGWSSPSAWLMD